MAITLTGTVERVVFSATDSQYVVARLLLEDVESQLTYDDFTTIVGHLGPLLEGERLQVSGEWEKHPRHGRHFRVHWFQHKLPSTTKGLERFLGSGIIKGVGPATAEMVVRHFGEETLLVLDQQPERLSEIPRLSKKRANLITAGWREHYQIRELMLFLQSHDLPLFLAKRLRDEYGDEAVAVLQRDPYQLVHDVWGIGFKTADTIAVNLGLPSDSLSRMTAGISYVLDEAGREGHVYLPKPELLKRSAEILSTKVAALEPALLEASRTGAIVLDDDRVYRNRYFYAERTVANRIQHLQFAPSFVQESARLDPASAAYEVSRKLGLTLAAGQRQAVEMALREKVSILTGGPGTGKTMCLHALITALDDSGLPYMLCAPTGRAAKRMASATQRNASTIHRLLGYQPADNSFSHNADDPLSASFVIVDEVSMVDIQLVSHLLQAIPNESHLLLVGDSDQLPAVGAGNVLADMLASGTIPAVELSELFRQAAGSAINAAAQDIRRGRVPQVKEASDLFMIPVSDPNRAQEIVEEMVARRIPARFGLDSKLDIQVMSPIHRGPAGVMALNRRLQELLNPSTTDDAIEGPGGRFRPGDKVMQIRNNYEKETYNGDVGIVSRIDLENRKLEVRFGDGPDLKDVMYEFSELDELVLAYAVSIHKAQGSEFPCVVVPILTSHWALLQRNLIYTAVTRAERLCVIVYQPKALELAVSAQRRDQRYTFLGERLKLVSFDPSLELSLDPL